MNRDKYFLLNGRVQISGGVPVMSSPHTPPPPEEPSSGPPLTDGAVRLRVQAGRQPLGSPDTGETRLCPTPPTPSGHCCVFSR